MEPRAMIGRNLDTCTRGPPLIKLIGYEHWENAVRGGGSRQWQTHRHKHSVPRDTHDGWRLGQGSDAILTHIRVVRPLTKLMGYENRVYAVGGGESRQWQTYTNPECDSQGG